MDNMIDQVARAMFQTDWDGADEGKRRAARALACKAIAAMRDPTFEMEKALRVVIEAGPQGGRVGPPFVNRDSTVYENHEVAVAGWRRMIDFALGRDPLPNPFGPLRDGSEV